MRLSLSLSLCLLLTPAVLSGASRNPADYPLRIHIFGRNQTTFYHARSLDESKGEGRANLFEKGEARGVDFNYACSDKLKTSFGYESYPAKWKKPGRELTVLMPVFGKSNAYWTCNLETDVKDFAYAEHNGRMNSEPVEAFKTWMVKHDYDPEHGKDVPTRPEPPAAAVQPSAPPQQ
ncbi:MULTISPECIES: hypothetical protein [Acidobacteriaceae]|uniref:hypothetical protein n=1 Tax=Acidobacteriaceae TaxID=204434 RepID=UPI00131C0B95|nr:MULTISPECIES: hypothetical protein [Acidobacteriaceae]MDW5264395.1 hypothetical protein [Edaphobacter sp.]